jgi:D-alanyl-lipoteichoic acid acyltransferase DltB (MBOAT superfamily)
MLFNSFQFAYFFLLLFPIYWLMPHRPQNLLLLAASYYFYSCWNWHFTSLLLISTVVDYFCGLAVDRAQEPHRRKMAVAFSMALNLGFLGYFKYCNFFAESFQAMAAGVGWHISMKHLEIALPIGISFYTFQSMSYVIDVYRKEIPPTRNFFDFAAFVSFFPHLVAGPIMRPTTLLPQIQQKRRFNLNQFYDGCYLIFWGLTKKVVVADNLAPIVDELFNKSSTIDGGLALLAIFAFAWQIYCDFSGYTDAARGISKCLGFELALNFNLPYFATSPQDFWRRWHISLSKWLQDYLYISLGGSRGPSWFVYRNLMLTMIIGGLWHGASWAFILWGTYQGLILCIHRVLKPQLERIKPTEPIDAACWAGVRICSTFAMVLFGWLIFRAHSMDQLRGMLQAIVYRPAIPAASYLVPVLVIILPLYAIEFAQYKAKDLNVIARTPWYVRSVFYAACFYAFVLGGNFGGSQFIYFQF